MREPYKPGPETGTAPAEADQATCRDTYQLASGINTHAVTIAARQPSRASLAQDSTAYVP